MVGKDVDEDNTLGSYRKPLGRWAYLVDFNSKVEALMIVKTPEDETAQALPVFCLGPLVTLDR